MKKLNLLEILQWKVHSQCYVPKFPPFVVFQSGTSGGDIDEVAVLNSQGTCLGWESWADQHRQLSRTNDPEEVSQELKENVGEEENSPLLCVRDLNTWTDSHGQTMS